MVVGIIHGMVHDIPAHLGGRIRRTRILAGLRQVDVAARAGVSQSLVSRIELGNGGAVPLTTWVAVASAVSVDVLAEGDQSARALDVPRRCHRLVTDLALAGGWAWGTDLERNETVLVRSTRHEVAVVRVWDVIANVRAAIDSFDARIQQEAQVRGATWTVRGAVVIPSTGANRRRLTESDDLVRRAFTARSAAWVGALRSGSPMPGGSGMIWTDQRMERLRPMLPYIDRRRLDRRR